MIHDGARPFVTEEELHRLHKATQNTGAAFLAVPVTDHDQASRWWPCENVEAK